MLKLLDVSEMLSKPTQPCTTSVECVQEKQVCIGCFVPFYKYYYFQNLFLVLVLNGASPAGSIAIQLAMMGGVKVLTTAASAEELLYLQNFQPSIGKLAN